MEHVSIKPPLDYCPHPFILSNPSTGGECAGMHEFFLNIYSQRPLRASLKKAPQHFIFYFLYLSLLHVEVHHTEQRDK